MSELQFADGGLYQLAACAVFVRCRFKLFHRRHGVLSQQGAICLVLPGGSAGRYEKCKERNARVKPGLS